MDNINKINLKTKYFSEKEEIFVKYGSLTGKIFTYDTGIKGVKFENSKGYIIVLPFKGQQIWDAVFNGRRLKMKSMFPKPRNVDNFINSYGAFMMHCGALRMGCPSTQDTHPLHGELPYANYDKADIIFGENEKGKYIGLTGLFEYNAAFSFNYYAIPMVKLYENSTVMDISMEIQNISNYTMELMYMCHVNFLPVDNGKIFQSVKWNEDGIRVRDTIPQHVKSSKKYIEFIDELKEKPELTQTINPNHDFSQEIVFFIKNPIVDNNKFAHFLQVHKDDSADYVSYKPEEFDHSTRWIVRNKDLEALGLILPATADAEGYIAEKQKGNVKEIPGKGSKTFEIHAGYLDKEEAKKMQNHINSLLN
jgi:hypothetical protein